MHLRDKILSVLPLLPLPGAALFLIHAISVHRVMKKILYLITGSTFLLLSISGIVIALYTKAVLEEARFKNRKQSVKKQNECVKSPTEKVSVPELDKITDKLEEYCDMEEKRIRPDGERKKIKNGTSSAEHMDHRNSCDEAENLLPSELQTVHLPEKGRPSLIYSESKEISITVVNKSITANSNADAILKVTSDPFPVFLIDPDEVHIRINAENMLSPCIKRQLEMQGILALYNVFDENNLALGDAEYEYAATQEPCQVTKLADGSYRVVRKGKLLFRKS